MGISSDADEMNASMIINWYFYPSVNSNREKQGQERKIYDQQGRFQFSICTAPSFILLSFVPALERR